MTTGMWLPFGLCAHLLLDCIVIKGYTTLYSHVGMALRKRDLEIMAVFY